MKEQSKKTREYKDRTFRLLFSEPDYLLELFNALYGTRYEDSDVITINTLEDATYMKVKNDLSFILDNSIQLFEHQSSLNPNMPLRGLVYLAELYRDYYLSDPAIYGTHIVTVPTPQYVVFYNGTDECGDREELKLSTSFSRKDIPGCIELTATMININYGKNKELLDKCKPLSDYARFIAIIRRNAKTISLENAIINSVDYCIEHNILKDFLLSHKEEVVKNMLFEYDQQKHDDFIEQEAKSQGKYDVILSALPGFFKHGITSADKISSFLNQPLDLVTKAIMEYESDKK